MKCWFTPEEALVLDWVNKPLEQSVGSISAVVDLRQIRQERIKSWTLKSFTVMCLTILLLEKQKIMSFKSPQMLQYLSSYG